MITVKDGARAVLGSQQVRLEQVAQVGLCAPSEPSLLQQAKDGSRSGGTRA